MNNNLTVAQDVLQKDSSNAFVIVVIAAIVMIVVLVAVIIWQNNKIKEIQKPRFGFLGKPLYAVIAIFLTVGSFGVVYYGLNRPTQIQQTSANVNVVLTIKAFALNTVTNDYSISVIPILDGIMWGGDSKNSFDAYWTISNTNNPTISITEAEPGLNITNTGGIIEKLSRGINEIKVTVFYLGKSYSNTKEVIIP